MKDKFTREEVEQLLWIVFNSEYAYGIKQYAQDNNFVRSQAVSTAVNEVMTDIAEDWIKFD